MAKKSSGRHAALSYSALSGNFNDAREAKKDWASRLLKRPSVPAQRAFSVAVTPNLDWNLMGVGVGEKISDGGRTGVMAVKFLVRAKYSEKHISKKHMLPKAIAGIPVDVDEVGLLRRFAAAAPAPSAPNPRLKIRPAQPGSSIGFKDPTDEIEMAGTFGALVKDAKGTYILSNNHVLAFENQLSAGAPIFQPGLLDLDKDPEEIAKLTRFIPLQKGVTNQVDCAIAQVDRLKDVSNSILQIGPPKGVGNAQIDMTVQKFGRTTGFSVGQVTSIDTDVTVQYETGSFTFGEQIIITGLDGAAFSNAGDSGSLIVERSSNQAVALLFAGSPTHTIANHISDVLAALKVTLV